MLKKIPTRQAERLPILIFTLGALTFALPIDEIVEVEAMVELIPVLDSPVPILGLVNRHGTVLPLIDLRVVFKQPAAPLTSTSLFIVATYQHRSIGLVVDEVHQVEYISAAEMKEALSSGKYIRGIINHKSELIPMIALAPLINTFLADQQLG